MNGLFKGSWLHEKPVQFDVTPGVVTIAAEGPGVGAEGSGEGETAAGEADVAAVGDGEIAGDEEVAVAPQPATRPTAARPTARPRRRPSLGRLW